MDSGGLQAYCPADQEDITLRLIFSDLVPGFPVIHQIL